MVKSEVFTTLIEAFQAKGYKTAGRFGNNVDEGAEIVLSPLKVRKPNGGTRKALSVTLGFMKGHILTLSSGMKKVSGSMR
jgi:hypothetical protein